MIETARPDQYAEVEAVSRGADPHEVLSPLTAPLLRWFLDENPCGRGFVVVAREAVSRAIIGYFVFYRWTLRRRTSGGSVDTPSALYVRLFVERAHRRRGIFARMTRFGLDRLAATDIPIAYTAPNPRSSPGFVKFGMQCVGPLPFWIRPALRSWSWIAGPPPRAVTVERRERFDTTFDRLFDASLPAGVQLWSPRAAAMLNWRYVDRPDVAYEIRYLAVGPETVGFVVTRRMTIKGQDVVAVCDFWVAPGSESALRAGVDDVVRTNVGARAAIAIGASAAPHLTRALIRAAFIRCPATILPQPVLLFGGPVGASTPPVTLPDLHAWYVTPYDWDVF